MTNSDTRVAVYTGSFDPITLGHLNVIERSSRLVDRLIVGIGINIEKQSLFSPEERLDLVVRSIATPDKTSRCARSPAWPCTSAATAAPACCCAACVRWATSKPSSP